MTEPKTENLLEKAKLISDLASAWQNKELADLMAKLPNGARVFEIFSEAVNREMAQIMSGKKDDGPQLQVLSKQVEQMAGAMGNFHQLILGFINSPLVQVLDLMNKNLGARGHQFAAATQPPQQQAAPQARQQAPQVQDDDDNQPSRPRARGGEVGGLGSF